MATLVLGAVGSSIGLGFGGAFLGLSGAAIGGMIGATVGSAIDSWLISSLAPAQRIEGARLDTLRITSSTEGAIIPRVYGRMRIGGSIIWATDFREETRTTTQRGGGKGGGPRVRTTEISIMRHLLSRFRKARSPASDASGPMANPSISPASHGAGIQAMTRSSLIPSS